MLVGRKPTLAMMMLVGLWFVLLFDPHWWLAGRGLTFVLKLPLLLFIGLGVTLVFELLTVKDVGRRASWYAPLLFLTLVTMVTVPTTINAGLARVGVQTLFLYWMFIIATAALIDTARRAEALVIGYGLQFLFWTVYGTAAGLVFWHPTMANYDTYGAWMVIGGGMCAFLVLATDDKKLRRLLLVAVVLCAVGVVSSSARGAFLAAIAVGGVTWLRSPRKGKAIGYVLACVLVFVIAASVLHGAAYWEEMATILDGTEEATGEDRWEMWKAAVGVWQTHPFFGVGFDNWGIFASTYYQPGELGGPYVDNPSMLWGKSAHNQYVTVLAENGLVGLMVFLWLFVDFWRRNRYLRTPEAGRRWAALGGRLKLTPVALAIEAAMIGWMSAAALYSLAGNHWLYTLLAVNVLLHTIVTKAPPGSIPATAAAGARRRPLRHAPRMAAAAQMRSPPPSPAPRA